MKTQTSKTPNQYDFARKQSTCGHARARKVYSRSNFELLRLEQLPGTHSEKKAQEASTSVVARVWFSRVHASGLKLWLLLF